MGSVRLGGPTAKAGARRVPVSGGPECAMVLDESLRVSDCVLWDLRVTSWTHVDYR